LKKTFRSWESKDSQPRGRWPKTRCTRTAKGKEPTKKHRAGH